VEKFSAAVVGGDPAAIAKMKEVYPPSPDPMDSGARIWDDYLFHGPTLVESRRFASSKVKVFNYRFTWAWTRTKGLGFGAHHTSELPLLFNQASVCTPFESYLAARFSGYLAAFAATGEPGDGWPEYSLSSPKVLEFQRDGKIRVNHEKEIKGRDDEGVVAMWYGLGVKKVGGWEVAVKKARL
jgi:carboxylesterase type B